MKIEEIADIPHACIERVRYRKMKRNDAFMLRRQLQKANQNQKVSWRVGMAIKDRVVFDIDEKDEKNCKDIAEYYGKLLYTKFFWIETLHGYHLISTKKYPAKIWKMAVAVSLCETVTEETYEEWKENVEYFYSSNRKEIEKDGKKIQVLEKGRDEFCKAFQDSTLCDIVGNRDIMHTINAVLYGRYILRVTKKDSKEKTKFRGVI